MNANSEIDFLKLETNLKVKRVNTENKKINEVKESQLKYIKERLEKEKEINKALNEKIKEVENRIKELMEKIDKTSVQENNKNNEVLKEIADMNKFLSELWNYNQINNLNFILKKFLYLNYIIDY